MDLRVKSVMHVLAVLLLTCLGVAYAEAQNSPVLCEVPNDGEADCDSKTEGYPHCQPRKPVGQSCLLGFSQGNTSIAFFWVGDFDFGPWRLGALAVERDQGWTRVGPR
uniref:Wall-associated receptor kinase galacturonan-binding domain-containing protein n=1 Tax=Fagus sylvatica TaxID=28930 RepID=A0A2N9HNL6_FAGSY